jgi:hypothetical protein
MAMDNKTSDKTKLLALFRFWCFGTFIIIFAAVTVYIGLFVSWQEALSKGLPIWGLVAVMCVIWYYAYKWFLNRKN